MTPRKKPADARLQIRLPQSDKDEFERVALEAGFSSLSHWLLWLARNAAKESRPKK